MKRGTPKGFQNTKDVRRDAHEMSRIAAERQGILGRHTQILARIKRHPNEPVSYADQMELQSAMPLLQSLNEEESTVSTRLQKRGAKMDGYAQVSDAIINRYKQNLDAMAQAQGRGFLTIVLGIPVGHAIHAALVTHHNNIYRDNQHGYAVPKRERKAVINAVNEQRYIHHLPG